MIMLRASFATLLIVIGAAPVFSQQPAKSDAPPTCSFSEIYRKDGWTVPGASGAKAKKPRAPLGNIPGVFLTMLEPGEAETNMATISCSRDHPGRLEIEEDAPIQILALWSFDFGGRIFAYRVVYGCEVINSGKREHLACASTVFFYDMDGSGRLTLSDGGRGVAPGKNPGFLPSFIPDWAKNNAGAASTR
ncbi:MAG: hypothetical protein ABSC48_07845 [Terracidiphilus sp.]|jgi:hypothetical protein